MQVAEFKFNEDGTSAEVCGKCGGATKFYVGSRKGYCNGKWRANYVKCATNYKVCKWKSN